MSDLFRGGQGRTRSDMHDAYVVGVWLMAIAIMLVVVCVVMR